MNEKESKMAVKRRMKQITSLNIGVREIPMGKKIQRVSLFIIAIIFTNTFSTTMGQTVYPTGVTIYKPDSCWSGYTLVPYEPGPIFLIDMNGRIVHKWNLATERAKLLPNGNIVIIKERKVLEYSWDNNLIWQYEVPTDRTAGDRYPNPGIVHHDLERLPNGNTIFLVHDAVPESYMQLVQNPERRKVKLIGDCIYEVNQEGKIVWEWHAYEYLDLNDYSNVDGLRDWTHSNTVQVLPENHWTKEGHEEFKPGNVMISVRHLDLVLIIDRETKKVVWTYKGDYMGGLAHQHEPHMIKAGLPGEGNILIFDNGVGAKNSGHDGNSLVLEINPLTKKIIWKYEYEFDFFSAIQSSAQRLANGNTFIDESCTGTIYEVTRNGEIVWEYVMPPLPGSNNDRHGFGTRPNRYGYDYCPQLKSLPKPEELAVTPPKNEDWHLAPDVYRSVK